MKQDSDNEVESILFVWHKSFDTRFFKPSAISCTHNKFLLLVPLPQVTEHELQLPGSHLFEIKKDYRKYYSIAYNTLLKLLTLVYMASNYILLAQSWAYVFYDIYYHALELNYVILCICT